MFSIKEEVAQLLERLPADSTLEDIQYHLYVLEKVHRGLDEIERGEGIAHEEAVQRLRKWRVTE
jgi:predicted transcriptional regulator